MRLVSVQAGRRRLLRCKRADCGSDDLVPVGIDETEGIGRMFKHLDVLCAEQHPSRFTWSAPVLVTRADPVQ